MQKLITYFLVSDTFNKLPYGATASEKLMTQAAEIVIKGHIFTKHPEGFMGQEVSHSQLENMKKSWKGIVVSAPCL